MRSLTNLRLNALYCVKVLERECATTVPCIDYISPASLGMIWLDQKPIYVD